MKDIFHQRAFAEGSASIKRKNRNSRERESEFIFREVASTSTSTLDKALVNIFINLYASFEEHMVLEFSSSPNARFEKYEND